MSSFLTVVLFLAGANVGSAIGFQANYSLTEPPYGSHNQGFFWNQETPAVSEPESPPGCLGLPPNVAQPAAAFIGGHLGGWVLNSVVIAVESGFSYPRMWILFPIGGWLFWVGRIDPSFQKQILATWCYAGVPLGAALGTMWSGKRLGLEEEWWPTALGALAGDAAYFALAAGYYLIFGDPWAYSPEGAPPTNAQLISFIYPVLLGGSILPPAGAVIGYNLSLRHKGNSESEDMGYRPSWTQEAMLSLKDDRDSRMGEPSMKVTLIRVSF